MLCDAPRMNTHATRTRALPSLRAAGGIVVVVVSCVVAQFPAAGGAEVDAGGAVKAAEPAERPGMFRELLEFETAMKRVTPAPGEHVAAAQARCCRALLDACERRYGPRSSEVAEALFALADQLFSDGATAEAVNLMRRGVEIREAVHGATAVELTCDLFTLAEFLEREGRIDEALPLVEQALAIHEDASGAEHPDTVLALQRLAELHAGLGHRNDAAAFTRRARQARTADHPETKPTALDWPQLFRPHEHCGARLFGEGKVAEATFHFQRAVELRPELGENHNNMGTAYSTQAQAAQRRDDEEEAEDLMQRAVAEFQEACRLEPRLPAIRVNLANALVAARRFDEATAVYEGLLADEPDNAALLNNHGVALYRSGRKQEAIEQFRKALAIDPDLRDAQESLAIALGEDAEKPTP